MKGGFVMFEGNEGSGCETVIQKRAEHAVDKANHSTTVAPSNLRYLQNYAEHQISRTARTQ
jgi:thymidylate kinase